MIFLLSCTGGLSESADSVDLIDLIDPFIGTGGIGYGVGGSYPGAARPFSLVKVSPDTCASDDLRGTCGCASLA